MPDSCEGLLLKRAREKTVVLSKSDFWSGGRLFWEAAKLGVVVFWLGGFVLAVAQVLLETGILPGRGPGQYRHWLVAIACLVVAPALLWSRDRHQLTNSRRTLLAGLGFGAGLVATIAAVGTNAWLTAGPGHPAAMSVGLVILFGAPLLYAVISWVCGSVLRRSPSATRWQNGTLCPGCGYCLIGTTQMRCPECGRAFTFSEIETTPNQFRETAAVATRRTVESKSPGE